MHPEFTKYQEASQKLGTDILLVSKAEYQTSRNMLPAPFTSNLGIVERDGGLKVLITADNRYVVEAIHELGHICVNCREEYDFFGWDYAFALQLNVMEEWRQSNYRYGVGGSLEFGDLSRNEQDDLLQERLYYARNAGFLDERYKPTRVTALDLSLKDLNL